MIELKPRKTKYEKRMLISFCHWVQEGKKGTWVELQRKSRLERSKGRFRISVPGGWVGYGKRRRDFRGGKRLIIILKKAK